MDLETELGVSIIGSSLVLPVLRALNSVEGSLTSNQIRGIMKRGSSAATHRVIENLVRINLVIDSQYGSIKVYAINRDHRLYPAVMELIRK